MPNRQKSKSSKKQRTPRVVSNPKMVHREGGRRPQPQVISSEKRVEGIRNALRKEMEWHLSSVGHLVVESGSVEEQYLEGMLGIVPTANFEFSILEEAMEDETARYLERLERLRDMIDFAQKDGNAARQLKHIQEAFVWAYKAVPDAAFIDLPGRNMKFFGPMMVQKLQVPNRPAKKHQPKARSLSPMASALIDSGNAKPRAHDGLKRELAASGLSS